jgi:hypothetical protein
MTVKELINKLSKADPNLRVFYPGDGQDEPVDTALMLNASELERFSAPHDEALGGMPRFVWLVGGWEADPEADPWARPTVL